MKKTILGNERGGVSVMIFALIALMFCILVMVFCLDYMMLYNKQNKIKNDLNTAVHAGSLSIDESELANGSFKLDTTTPGQRVQDMFYKYLQLNMKLDNQNRALAGSKLKAGTSVNIDELLYIDYEAGTITNLNSKPTACTYTVSTSTVSCSITLNPLTKTQITRTVNQTIVGPSLVAIIDTVHESIGSIVDEPLLIPAVQEVYFAK